MLAYVLLFSGILAFTVFVVVGGTKVEARRRKKIAAALGERGCSVRSVLFGSGKSMAERQVIFVSREGDLRCGIVKLRRGNVDLISDEPFQRHLARPLNLSTDNLDYDKLMWAVEVLRLPGHRQYQDVLLQVRKTGLAIEIDESPPNQPGHAKFQFAAILQCIVMSELVDDDCTSGTLDVVTNEESFPVSWRVEGTAPNRTLILSPTGMHP